MSKYGIDVSYYQGAIDWAKVKAAGKDFAMIRLGWCGYDGAIVANKGLDSMFATNMKNAAAAGVDVGVYVYSYAKTAAAAKVAARETLALVKDYTLTYPIAFDIEDTMYHAMTAAQNTAITDAYLSEIEAGGYYGMLYTYKSFAEAYLTMSSLQNYDFWVAQWSSSNTYTGPYGMWQYSNTGTVNGVSGALDLNIAYRDYPSVIKNAGLNNLGGGDTGGNGSDGGDAGNSGSDGGDTSTGGNSGNGGDESGGRLEQLESATQAIKAIVDEL